MDQLAFSLLSSWRVPHKS